MKKSEVVWSENDNSTGTKSAIHCYKTSERGLFVKYMGNKSLCGKFGVHDGGKYVDLKDIEPISQQKFAGIAIFGCKSCLKSYQKLSEI